MSGLINKGFQGVVFSTGKAKSGYTWYAIDLVFITKNGKKCYRRVWLSEKDVRSLCLTDKYSKK